MEQCANERIIRQIKKNNANSMLASSPSRLVYEVEIAAFETVESESPKQQRKLARVFLSQPSEPCMYKEYSDTEENMIVKLEKPEDVDEHQKVDQDQEMEDALENLKREHDYTPIPPVVLDQEIFCETCGKTCKSKPALTRHMQTHAATARGLGGGRRKQWGGGPWECELCGRVYKSRNALSQHRKSHSGERPHQCTYCPKAFVHREKLTKHIRTHTGERPFPCSMCPKRLSCKLSLECHERTHTGERPFECSVCSKTFAVKQYLENHMRTHTGEKPYQCTECPMAFAIQITLNRHKLVHTGEKPHTCPICFKKFTQSSSVKLHVRTVHEGQKSPYGRRARREKLRLAKAKAAPSPPPPPSLNDSLFYYEDDDDDLE